MIRKIIILLIILVGWSFLALSQNSTGRQDPSHDAGGFEHGKDAYHNNNKKAKAANNEAHTYWGYPFNLDAEVQITGIEVRLDAGPERRPENAQLAVELSWDGGMSWTSTGYSVSIPKDGERQTYLLGGVRDTWDRTWTVPELASPNFRVRITATMNTGKIRLYWIPVRIYYTTQVLTLSPSSIDFGELTTADYTNGYKEIAPAQTLYIASSTSWVVTIKALSDTWAYTGGEPDPLKPSIQLEWKSFSSDPAVSSTNATYTGMTTIDVPVAAGNPGVNIEVQVFFKLLLSYDYDPSGTYNLSFLYTLTGN